MIRRLARKGVRRAERYKVGSRPYGVVLIYHRVASPLADPWNMAVSPENFAAHLEILKRFAVPRTMCDLAADLSNAGAPKRSIAVTFDDGYVDNLSTALPLMDAHDVPGSVFVISGAIGKPDAFWWDLLVRVFLVIPHLPASLTIEADGVQRCFDLGSVADYGPEAIARSATWNADLSAPRDGRQRLLLDVWNHLLSLSVEGRTEAVQQIRAWSGAAAAFAGQDTPRPMEHHELARLAASGLIEIGGHTVSHPDLAQLSPGQACIEIARGRADLMEWTGQSVDGFAYPYGRYSDRTASQIREAGFSCAAWSHPGLATSSSEAFTLPRLHMTNLNGDAFAALLRDVLGPPHVAI